MGNIHANSTGTDCRGDPVAFSRTGGATVEVRAEGGACQAVGDIQDPTDDLQCAKQSPSFVMPDPLQWLAEPPRPTVVAPDMDLVGEDPDTTDQPDRCPGADGGDAPRLNQTQPCDVGGNGAAYANKSWILYPGLYPAGLAVTNGATAYLMPGIYWLGGGGLNVKGGGAVISIATEADAALTPAAATFGGGVLLYNGEPGNEGPINMEGSAATMKLEPFDVADGDPLSVYNDIVIFQSRTVDDTITLNGSASITDINGIIYSPIGGVKLNGNGPRSRSVTRRLRSSRRNFDVQRETAARSTVTGRVRRRGLVWQAAAASSSSASCPGLGDPEIRAA